MDDIKRRHGLAPGMLGVSDGVSKEVSHHRDRLLIDIATDSLDTCFVRLSTDVATGKSSLSDLKTRWYL